MTDHPITLPPELVQDWRNQAPTARDAGLTREWWIATQAARWGADQELEACCEWVSIQLNCTDQEHLVPHLRATRRPKLSSLKEQALAILDDAHRGDLGDNEMAIIRRALEQLDD